MFEDSLFESYPRAASSTKRWTAAASILTQATVASLLLILPLLHVERLPSLRNEQTIAVPLPVPPPPPPPRTAVQRASSALATAVPVLQRMLSAPRIIPQRIDTSAAPATVPTAFSSMGSALPGNLIATGTGTGSPTGVAVSVRPEKDTRHGPVRVSAGVSAGLLLTPIRPVYPPIAKAAHVEGTVVVEAIISRSGSIESAHALSGPAMLQTAALDAIRAARYQPFKLNGDPTEVQTTITVNFRIGS